MPALRDLRPLSLALLAMLLCSCHHLEPVENHRELFEDWNDQASGYRFLPGDELDIKLIYNPEFSDRVIVAPDGKIYLDLIGSVSVQDKRPEEVAEDIRNRYATQLRHPDVTIAPRMFGSQAIYVGGEVNKPGMFKLAHNMTVLQGIMEAGGLQDTAHLDQVILLRKTLRDRPMLRVIKLRDILEGKNPADDIPLQRFDVVFVPRSDIAEADRIAAQYVDKLVPVQRSMFVGFYPGVR